LTAFAVSQDLSQGRFRIGLFSLRPARNSVSPQCALILSLISALDVPLFQQPLFTKTMKTNFMIETSKHLIDESAQQQELTQAQVEFAHVVGRSLAHSWTSEQSRQLGQRKPPATRATGDNESDKHCDGSADPMRDRNGGKCC
jgi:hypothetical protein